MVKKDNYLINGNIIKLRSPKKSDAKGSWSAWLNNLENLIMLGRLPLPNTPEQQIDYMIKNQNNVDRIIFMVCLKSNNKIIGVVSLSNISRYHQSAQTGLLIGEKKYRSIKVAIEAMSLLTEYALIYMNLNRLDASALINNPQSYLLNKFLGWRKVGVKKKSHFHKGVFVDTILYEILRSHWLKSKKRPLKL